MTFIKKAIYWLGRFNSIVAKCIWGVNILNILKVILCKEFLFETLLLPFQIIYFVEMFNKNSKNWNGKWLTMYVLFSKRFTVRIHCVYSKWITMRPKGWQSFFVSSFTPFYETGLVLFVVNVSKCLMFTYKLCSNGLFVLFICLLRKLYAKVTCAKEDEIMRLQSFQKTVKESWFVFFFLS